MGSLKSNPIVCSNLNGCHYEVQNLKLASHDLHIGMRWLIGANAQGNGQALYWGENGATSGSLSQGIPTGYGAHANAPLVKRY